MLQLAVNKRDSTSKDRKAPWHYLPTNNIFKKGFTPKVKINFSPGGNITQFLIRFCVYTFTVAKCSSLGWSRDSGFIEDFPLPAEVAYPQTSAMTKDGIFMT